MKSYEIEKLRKLAIELLDDENGINENAYLLLKDMLSGVGINDIQLSVDATDGRFYLDSVEAANLKKDKSTTWYDYISGDLPDEGESK